MRTSGKQRAATQTAVQQQNILKLRRQYAAQLAKFRMWGVEAEIQSAIDNQMADFIDRHNIVNRDLTPQEWVQIIMETTIECDNCPGDGIYRWGGTINGKSRYQNTCYRCGGKGRMTADDCARTRTYFNKQRVV